MFRSFDRAHHEMDLVLFRIATLTTVGYYM